MRRSVPRLTRSYAAAEAILQAGAMVLGAKYHSSYGEKSPQYYQQALKVIVLRPFLKDF